MSRINQDFGQDNGTGRLSAAGVDNKSERFVTPDAASAAVKDGDAANYSMERPKGVAPAEGGKANGKNRVERRSAWRVVLLIAALLVATVSYIAVFALCDITLMPWWLPWLIGVPVAVATGLHCARWWQRVTWLKSAALNYCVHVVVVAGAVAMAFMLANRIGSENSGEVVEARLEKVYSEQRHHSRRVGRRYVRGDAYYVYRADVEVEGRHKTLNITRSQYSRLRRATTVEVPVSRGLFGFRILESKGLKAKKE